MKNARFIGIILLVTGLLFFSAVNFFGSFVLTRDVMEQSLTEREKDELWDVLETKMMDKEYSTSWSFSSDLLEIYNRVNDNFRAEKRWAEILPDAPKEFALRVARNASSGWIPEHRVLLFLLSFGLAAIGGLLYIFSNHQLLKHLQVNNGIFNHASTNRGWISILVFLFLVKFYVLLYFFPYVLVHSIEITDVVKQLFLPEAKASQWFLYGLIYTLVMIVMGVRMFLKYKGNRYQIFRTVTVVLFQVVFAFLIVEILPIFDLPARDLKNAWPLDYTFLYEWNVKELLVSGNFGKFLLIWGILLALVIVPVMVYFFGKRWYCSWVCGCGGLAETLGDPYRQLSVKKLWAWKLERWLVHGVLVFAILMTVLVGYVTFQTVRNPSDEVQSALFGISAFSIREYYGFLIGSIFAGVIGTGFYPVFGNRTWCRFGCPLAAYMGIIQRFKSRFRITTNGGQCISCGNCSTYCEQGIDVRAYAQKGQNIVRASCVGCGVCASVCPRGVLKLENGPENGRFGNEGPIVLGNDGFKIKTESL